MIEANIAYVPGWEATATRALQLGYKAVVVGVTCKGDATRLESLLPSREVLRTSLLRYIDSAGVQLLRGETLVKESWCGECLDVLYTRLTVIVESMAQASTLNNRLAKCATHYDLIVAAPTDDKTLHFCCNTLACDMISWEPEYKLGLTKKLFVSAHDRHIPFELCAGHYLHGDTGGPDSQHGRGVSALLSNGAALAGCATKGRTGCVLSSGATNPAEVRAPQDFASVRVAIGTTHEDAWAATLLSERVREGRVRSVLEAGTFVFPSVTGVAPDDKTE